MKSQKRNLSIVILTAFLLLKTKPECQTGCSICNRDEVNPECDF